MTFSGGQADMVNVNANFVMPLKSDLSLEKAGGIAETFLTAYQLLHLVGEIKPTDCVLVHAAGSGVGTSAIQLGIVYLSIAIGLLADCKLIEKILQFSIYLFFGHLVAIFHQIWLLQSTFRVNANF